MYSLEIIPGILEKDWEEIERKIELVLPFANTIHIDLLDGKFADNKTFLDPQPFATYKDKVCLELHMMVVDPIQYIEPFATAGFQRFIGHVEHMKDQVTFVASAQEFGEVGLALDGPTSLDKITVPYTDLDVVTLMTIAHAGFSNQHFQEDTLKKIRLLRGSSDELFPIEVDGGTSPEALKKELEAGATRFVTTGFLFSGTSPQEQYNKLLSSLTAGLESE